MKWRLLYTILIISGLSTMQPVSAQFTAGVMAGLNMTQVDGDHMAGYNRVGLMGGIYVKRPVNKRFNGGFEILYSMKGSKERADDVNLTPDIFRLKFHYVEFPIFAEWTPFRWNVKAGPTIGVNVISERDEGFGPQLADIDRMEYGYMIDASYRFSDHLGIGLRHGQSLFRIGDKYDNGLNIWNQAGLYNRLFTIVLVVHLEKM